jgi:predicted RNA-binding Zn-ribbon protein involved in translation (DUF1610 family)
MNKVFCVSCGFKILYELKKPKFCSNCGEAIGGVSSSSTKEKEQVEEVSDLDVDLNKLKKGIVVEGKTKTSNLQELWSKDPSGQEILDQTMRDCASSRMRDIDEQ